MHAYIWNEGNIYTAIVCLFAYVCVDSLRENVCVCLYVHTCLLERGRERPTKVYF